VYLLPLAEACLDRDDGLRSEAHSAWVGVPGSALKIIGRRPAGEGEISTRLLMAPR